MNAGKRFLASQIVNSNDLPMDVEKARELALKFGEAVQHCRCSETLMQGLGLCRWCADQAKRDCNFIENALGMYEE